jgi:hypothetical protein
MIKLSYFLDIPPVLNFHIAMHHEIIPTGIVKQGPEMKPIQALTLSALALTLASAAARADDGLHGAAGLGEHPAVLVARRGVSADPTANFYLHPARLSWSLTRPLAEGEHPAVRVAHRAPSSTIDPNRFIVGHPARGSYSQPSQ